MDYNSNCKKVTDTIESEGNSMKYHKIRNVEKSVCTAEQKIAYNIAWRIDLSYGSQFRADLENVGNLAIDEAVTKLRDIGLKNYKLSYTYTDKYDIDAIFAALNAGLKKYLLKPFIATRYDEIGEAFPANYL